MAAWEDVTSGSKNNRLNQAKAREPCTIHCTYRKKSCRITCLASKQLCQFEQKVLQTGSSEGGLQWQKEGQQLHSTQYTVHGAQDFESRVAQGFVKHGFKVLLHRVVDGPLQASCCLISQTLCVCTRYTRVFWALALTPESRSKAPLISYDTSFVSVF